MANDQIQDMVMSHRALRSVLEAPVVKEKRVTSLSTRDGLTDFIQSIISKHEDNKDPFYVLDLGVLVSLLDRWNRSLPNVHPFYAVKCNPEPALLGALAALGTNFDCASQAEIEAVLALDVSPDRIVYANPCKAESHIRYAASVAVNLTTFDSLDEIKKIRRWHPTCQLLLRLKCPIDSGARYDLGAKYGALQEEVVPLLLTCHAEGMAVVGVSFHVGSAASFSTAYSGAIAAAKAAFDTATKLGMPRMRILNVGGGFTVGGSQFNDAAITIRAAVEEYFPSEPGLTIISEPGRFFAESVFILVVNIIGKRVRGNLREYWINDGIYGSLNYLRYEHATFKATPLACSSNGKNPTCRGEKTYMSTVFGPTLDNLDTVLTDYQLPELEVNDWLVFPDMGAYTAAAGTNFNGFNISAISTHLAFSNLS